MMPGGCLKTRLWALSFTSITDRFMDTLYPGDLQYLSRRAFLKRARAGLLGLFLIPLHERAMGRERLVAAGQEGVPEMGRVLDDATPVHQEPSFSSKLVNMYWRDLVYPISAATIGDKEPGHNRVWYQINNGGYIHSGKMQPVALRSNPAVEQVPKEGLLAEVSVPFTDARLDPDRPDRFAYRLYYSTTHWINAVVMDREGNSWYRIRDDKYRKTYYVDAEHLRPIPPEELTPISPHVPNEEKRIEVRLSQQLVIAYEAGVPIFMTLTATGGIFIEGNFSTPTGTFMTNRKRPSRHMASGDLAAPNSYDLPGVPWVCYLTLKGISFHGTYWHNDFGRPRSHGCLNLSSPAARWIYRYTMPNVTFGDRILETHQGTRVDIVE